MAKAESITITTTAVVLTLTQDEANTLRDIIGRTKSKTVDDLGLKSIWNAIYEVTEPSQTKHCIWPLSDV